MTDTIIYDSSVKKSALLVAVLTAFLMVLMGSSVNIALPEIARDLKIDAVLLTWVSTAFLLSAAMLLVPLGRLADIIGRKKMFLIGISVYTLSSFLSGFAQTPFMLISARVLQGCGGAMIFGTSLAILTSVYPPGERGRALGINVAAVYAGLSVGPFVGGLLTQQLGWRMVFYSHVPLGLIVIIVTVIKLKGEWAGAKGEKYDFLGALIYSLMLASFIYGVSLLPESKAIVYLVAGLVGLVSFIWWELRCNSPVMDINLFRRNRVFAFSGLAALINYSATFAVTFLLSLYLQYIKALTPQNAGLVLICQPIIMTVFSPFAGKLSDRLEPRIVASIGMSLTAIGLFSLVFIGENTSLYYVIASLIILGLGFAFFSSPNTNAIMSSVERRLYGVAGGTVSTMRVIGQVLSMGIAMLVFAIYIGRVEIVPEYYPNFISSLHILFIIFTFLCLAGIGASLARGEMRENNR